MRLSANRKNIEEWLTYVRIRIKCQAPQLLSQFDTYASEARFGRAFIDRDLLQLQSNAKVLEIGAGTLLLSCQLFREGFDVTALEPVGLGFSHFTQLQLIVRECAEAWSCVPRLLCCPAEELYPQTTPFEFAFSINVMEHVADWATVLERVTANLTVGGRYHFTCPNYTFPYEPHFNIPTLFGKKITELVLRSRISRHRNTPDPWATWKSLNWITVREVKLKVKCMEGVSLSFNNKMLEQFIIRVVGDADFSSRRSPWVKAVFGILFRWKLYGFAKLMPVAIQPGMDCILTLTSHKKR